ncbi:hypothetical protein [Wenyingzhuangia sp. IMCC45574]
MKKTLFVSLLSVILAGCSELMLIKNLAQNGATPKENLVSIKVDDSLYKSSKESIFKCTLCEYEMISKNNQFIFNNLKEISTNNNISNFHFFEIKHDLSKYKGFNDEILLKSNEHHQVAVKENKKLVIKITPKNVRYSFSSPSMGPNGMIGGYENLSYQYLIEALNVETNKLVCKATYQINNPTKRKLKQFTDELWLMIETDLLEQ